MRRDDFTLRGPMIHAARVYLAQALAEVRNV